VTSDIEISTLDLRYEGYRMRSPAQEVKLLVAIQGRGIERPLQGVDIDGQRVLLNGFKRYRCAKTLGIGVVPYASLGSDEATGIIAVLRGSNEKCMGILEQAKFIDDLVHLHQMSSAEVAETLSRSKAWVTMRLGLLREMSGVVREKILGGAFPIYSYMYTLRPVMRMNGAINTDVEAFVAAVSGRKLSVREVEQLAHGYFRGPAWFRQEIDSGNFALALERLKEVPEPDDGCSQFEGVVLKDIEILAKYMQRVIGKIQHRQLATPTRPFCAQASILLAGVLSQLSPFQQALRDLHDRIG
jgi:predicted transcriptional regulator